LSCYSLHGSHLQTLQAYKHIYIYTASGWWFQRP
jgi:hypothetical protein